MVGELITIPSLDVVYARLENSRRTVWLGALSFEERCTASVAAIVEQKVRLTAGIALEYETTVSPSTEAEEQRGQNWGILETLGKKAFVEGIRRQEVPAYNFQELQNILEDLLAEAEIDFVIIDITCLSKIHALAVAATLARFEGPSGWMVAYSTPENYGSLADRPQELPAWRDIIIAPMAETALLFNEASSRGIIIPGHEADRLIIALAEIEPEGGLIAVAESRRRPDLRYITERKNQRTIRRLRRMRMGRWLKCIICLTDLRKIRNNVGHEIRMAKQYDAPVIFFPYGPKSMIFAIGLQLACEYPEASWFVYPIPSSYDANYSSGAEEMIWLVPKEVTETAKI